MRRGVLIGLLLLSLLLLSLLLLLLGCLLLGFALCEATGLFGLVIALIILFT